MRLWIHDDDQTSQKTNQTSQGWKTHTDVESMMISLCCTIEKAFFRTDGPWYVPIPNQWRECVFEELWAYRLHVNVGCCFQSRWYGFGFHPHPHWQKHKYNQKVELSKSPRLIHMGLQVTRGHDGHNLNVSGRKRGWLTSTGIALRQCVATSRTTKTAALLIDENIEEAQRWTKRDSIWWC